MSDKPWYVYIVECSDGTFYTGISNDVGKRVDKHNKGKGASYTKVRTPVTLIYARLIGTMGEALKEERRIKKLSRAGKMKLIEIHE